MLTLALAGCSSSKPPETAKPPEVEIEVQGYAGADLFNGGRVTLYADGRKIGESDGGLVVRVPAHPRPQLTATVSSRCGTWDATVTLREKHGVSSQPGQAHPLVAQLDLVAGGPSWEDVELWVDNRGRPEARLLVNGEETVIAPGEKRHFRVVYELCPAMREVYLDGKLIGTLPDQIPELKDGQEYDPWDVKYSRNVLLDTSGRGCYRYTEYCYKRAGYKWCEGPESRTYRGKHLHRIPGEVNFFFEPPPKEIQAWDGIGAHTRAGLSDCGVR